ncbi:MAG: hypothetical protein AMXMBFR84_24530 [Candidatus Hydrogenedentota bacterium]
MLFSYTYFLLAVAALAGQPIVLKADRQDPRAGEPFRITVEVSGKTVSDLIAPNVDGLTIEANPQLRNEVSIDVNGSRAITLMQGYDVQAAQPGSYTISPFRARVDGQFVESNGLVINVRPQQETAGNAPGDPLTIDDFMRFTAEVDAESAYEGQAVTLTLALRWPDSAQPPSERQLELSDFPGFYTVQSDWQSVMLPDVRLDGKTFHGKGWTMVIFPTAQGEQVIKEAALTVVAMMPMPFGRTRPDVITLRTQPVTVNVKPLPTRPLEFTGSVGSFELKAEPPDPNAVQGVPHTLAVWVSGSGNPNALGEPEFPTLPWAEVRDAEQYSRPNSTKGGTQVDRRFTYTLIPLAIGAQEIPRITYCFFNPTTSSYETAEVGPFTLNVLKGSDSERVIVTNEPQSGTTQPEVDGLTGILGGAEVALTRKYGIQELARMACIAIAPMSCAAALLLSRSRRRPIKGGRKVAIQRAHQLLRQTESSRDPVQGIYRAILVYVSQRWTLLGKGLTSIEVEQTLREREVPIDITSALIRILKTCEHARYAGRELSGEEVDALRHAAAALLDQLDKLAKDDTQP